MENSKLTLYSQLKTENIDYHQFTLSLIKECLSLGIMTSAQGEQIQIRLMTLVSETILKYTNYESSSVREETAQSILKSILYVIDLYLMELSSLEEAVKMLQKKSLKEIYTSGLDSAQSEIIVAEQLYQEVKMTKIDVSLRAYNETIEESFHDFFDRYDINFDAHNTITFIDYPLLFDNMSWTGIIYIRKYLEHLQFENKICDLFPLNQIRMLVGDCGQKYRLSGEDLLVNITELVLKNSLGAVLMGRRANELLMSKEDINLLQSLIEKLCENEILKKVIDALEEIFKQLNISEMELRSYLLPFAEVFCQQLIIALRENSLFGLFIINETNPSGDIFYEGGRKLDDEDLRKFIARVRECRDGKAKADLIKREIHDIEDLEEVLDASCVFDEEYFLIFGLLGDYELAILSSGLVDKPPFDEGKLFSSGQWDLCGDEREWQEKLLHFLDKIDSQRSKVIFNLAKKIRR